VVDAVEDILGKSGKNSVLNFAGLGWMVNDPIDYDPDARVAIEDVTRLFYGVREIVGNKGYDIIMFKGGRTSVKGIVKHSVPLQGLIVMNLDPIEKLKLGYKAYITNAGYDPEKSMEHFSEARQIYIHRPDCTECEIYTRDSEKMKQFTEPSCSFIKGILYEIGNTFKETEVTVDEVKCRLLGDDECLYKIDYRIIG
jgi:predicted hydrocarbon binding protein